MMVGSTASDKSGGGWSHTRMRLGAILWFMAAIGVLLSLPVLIDIGWFGIPIVGLVALVVALPVALLVRAISHWRFGHSYIKSALGTFAVLAILVAAPIYVLVVITAVRPMTVPLAALSNGTKTVMFQGMMHIGSEGFYKSVVYDLEKALTENYVLFYEGVQPDPDGDAWFSQNMADGGDLSTNYTQFGSICGLQFQLDYFGLLATDMAAHPDRHVTADVTTGDMKREYERLVAADPGYADRVAAEVGSAAAGGDNQADSIGTLLNAIQGATPGQRSLIGTACRGWMTWVLSQATAPSALDPIILDYRNQHLANAIINGPDKIYITYGAQHLPGIIALLKASDPDWKLGSIKWSRVIDTPENLEGQLD